jgi:hypothetical protein
MKVIQCKFPNSGDRIVVEEWVFKLDGPDDAKATLFPEETEIEELFCRLCKKLEEKYPGYEASVDARVYVRKYAYNPTNYQS